MCDSFECPLCGADSSFFLEDARRLYVKCPQCRLVFVPDTFWLTPEQEKSEYDLHENAVNDRGYRKFLSRVHDPLVEVLRPGAQGLDFGCGPGPALADMLRLSGFSMRLFDLFYCNDDSVFESSYDFIVATEVVEHLREPRVDLERIWCCLREQGVLAVMTKRWTTRDAFSRWHYKNDPTHIVFFSDATFAFLAEAWGAEIIYSAADVVILQKPSV